MKKLLIAFSMVGAVACADAGSQSNSVTTNYAHDAWFSASASGETINPVGGSFSTLDGSASTFKANGGVIEIDGDDVSDPVSFVLLNETTGKTTDLTRVVFKLDASVVPFAALPKDTELNGVKTAFALVASQDKTTTNFYAWVGATPAWTSLGFTTIPDEDELYTLTMRFDDTVASAPKVQFTVGSESSAWLAYAGMSKTTKPQIDFVGCGKLKSMNADQVWVVSAEINFDGGKKVTIADKDAVAMGKLVGEDQTIEEVLALPAKGKVSGIVAGCELTVAEAYAIGMIAKGANDEMVAKDDGTFQVKADATASVEGGIKIGFVNSMTPNDTTAGFSYQLMGWTGDVKDSYVAIGEPVTDQTQIKIPTNYVDGNDGSYRFFKVVTTVTLAH